MRNRRSFMALALAAPLALSASVFLAQSSDHITPLNMSTGEWQTTTTVDYSGLPPQMAQSLNRTTTHKACVKPENLARNGWTKKMIGKCASVTVLNSTATDVDVEASGCDAGNGMTAGGRGKFHLVDSTHLTGTMDVTFTGATPFGNNSPIQMHAHYVSDWVSATCPADM